MKGTEKFKEIIQAHLNGIAGKDPLFAETLKKPNKNIDECINYIFEAVQKSGCHGFADEEVFGMAVHYYDEDNIKAPKASSGNVIVNHSIPATKEKKEKPAATKEKADSTPVATKPAKKQSEKIQVSSLFD